MSFPVTLALRDAAILLVTLLLWKLDNALRGDAGATATAIGVAAGTLTAICAYFAHEWGHLAGARLAKAVVHPPRSATSVFLFHFDSDRNDRRRFLGMSFGGFAASAVAVTLLWDALPRQVLSGRIALTLVLLGVVATLILEVPAAWKVARGGPLPRGGAYRSASETEAA